MCQAQASPGRRRDTQRSSAALSAPRPSLTYDSACGGRWRHGAGGKIGRRLARLCRQEGDVCVRFKVDDGRTTHGDQGQGFAWVGVGAPRFSPHRAIFHEVLGLPSTIRATPRRLRVAHASSSKSSARTAAASRRNSLRLALRSTMSRPAGLPRRRRGWSRAGIVERHECQFPPPRRPLFDQALAAPRLGSRSPNIGHHQPKARTSSRHDTLGNAAEQSPMRPTGRSAAMPRRPPAAMLSRARASNAMRHCTIIELPNGALGTM